METKVCSSCGESLPLHSYEPYSPDTCKGCVAFFAARNTKPPVKKQTPVVIPKKGKLAVAPPVKKPKPPKAKPVVKVEAAPPVAGDVPRVTPTEKACTKCGEVKAIDCFGINARRKDGRANMCLVCSAAYQLELKRKWSPERAEQERANQRDYYHRTRETRLANAKGRYATPEGRAKRSAENKAYFDKVRADPVLSEERKKYMRDYAIKNRDRIYDNRAKRLQRKAEQAE